MGYKLVALDIDGTIRSVDRAISQRTRNIVDRIASDGVVVTLATGRIFQSALAAASDLNLLSPVVSHQGAHIAYPSSGELLWHRPLTPDLALVAMEALSGWEGEIIAYIGDKIYVDKLTPWVERYGQRNRTKVQVVNQLNETAMRGPTRLVAVGSEDKVKLLESDLKSSFKSDLHVTRSLPHFCELLHPLAGKHNALQWLAEYFGFTKDEVVAFGNGYNDVDMLRWARLAVAVEGCVPEVLAVADKIAPSMEHDGVAQVLENFVEQGLLG